MQEYLPTEAWKHTGMTQECYPSCSALNAEGNVGVTSSTLPRKLLAGASQENQLKKPINLKMNS